MKFARTITLDESDSRIFETCATPGEWAISGTFEFSNLKEEQIDKIIKQSKKVLKKSIIKGGSSIRDFKNTSGNKGSFQNEFKVYNRESLKCPRITCRGKIFKIVVTNRSTFFCNKCQK